MTVDSSASPRGTEPGARPRFWPALVQSRVARRVVLLFVACALLPVAAVALLSYGYVGRQLMRDADVRLERGAKLSGQAVLERLGDIEEALAAAGLAVQRDVAVRPVARTRAMILAQPDGLRFLYGPPFATTVPTVAMAEHLARGRSVIRSQVDSGGTWVMLMGRAADSEPGGGTLWAHLDLAALVDELPFAPVDADVCLFGAGGVLTCALPGSAGLRDRVTTALQGASGALDAPRRVERWEDPTDGRTHVVGYWEMFLRSSFLADPWAIAVAEPRSSVLQPLASFNRTFPFVLLLSLLAVMLLSNVQIRRSLEPLTRLTDGTRRLARRDFTAPVVVESGDEFQELADSFNAMAGRLERQFRTIETRSAIDRTVLAALDIQRIVDVVMEDVPAVVGGNGILLALSPYVERGPWQVYAREATRAPVRVTVSPDEVEVAALEASAEPRWLPPGPTPSYVISPLEASGHDLLAVPLLLDHQAIGVLVLGYRDGRAPPDDVQAARQVADQLTVALANARLLDRLYRMNLGTVEALARAIDAKSPWTAGHSDRVTALALALGRQLGLDSAALEDLHRGGLLHDVGKIGVAATVLDKDGKLTPQEMDRMRRHVLIGAEILAPIPGYAGAMPIVRSHHERWDGTGYPDGLRGEEIPRLARILAVADVFDALTSDRPYRKGLPPPRALAHIREHAGRHFDPAIVDALVAVMAQPDLSPESRRADRAVR